MFQFSSTTALLGFAGAASWMQGRDDVAAERVERALSLPEELDHAPSLAFSLAFSQYTQMYRRQWDQVGTIAERLTQLAEDEELATRIQEKVHVVFFIVDDPYP